MKKRKKKATLLTSAVVFIMLAVSLVVINYGRRYRVDKGQIMAVYINPVNMFSPEISEENSDIQINSIVQSMNNSGINTAVVKINQGKESIINLDSFDYIYRDNDNFDKKDILKQLKKVFNKEKVQIYISLDCSNLSDETVLNTITQIHEEYSFAGVVLDNFNGENNVLHQIKASLGKGLRKTDFVLQSDDIQQMQSAVEKNTFDVYIGENISATDYTELKSAGAPAVLLHYLSSSIKSDIFALSNFSQFDGAVISDLSSGEGITSEIYSLMEKQSGLPVFDFNISNDFNVTYPTKDMATYYSGIFITGTGRTGGTVTVNNTEYPAQKDGSFGVYVELSAGDNVLNISRNENSQTVTVTRKTYSSSGGGSTTIPWDNTEKLEYGRMVQTVGPLTSMLSDPDDDSAVIAGVEQGIKLKVVDSVKTKRNGKYTYAYQLSNGGYVMANEVEITSEVAEDYNPGRIWTKYGWITRKTDYTEYKNPCISHVVHEKIENNDEILEFYINNPTAVITGFTSSKLTLHFLDAEYNDISLPDSDFYTNYEVIKRDDGTHITLYLSQEKALWGYDVSSAEDKITVYLKKAPKQKGGENPLAGITVMLDAGHGDHDSGALGVASTFGPLEKDLNLAVAQATKALLEQKGATVLMTRDDDTFLELEERRSLAREHKPDLFIAVHHNSMDYSYNSTNARGSECYYFTRQSKPLAELMCKNISVATDRYNRGAKVGRYYVTRTDIAPSVLMEYSFIINPKEFSNTYSDMDIYRAAYGTVQAVIEAIPK